MWFLKTSQQLHASVLAVILSFIFLLLHHILSVNIVIKHFLMQHLVHWICYGAKSPSPGLFILKFLSLRICTDFMSVIWKRFLSYTYFNKLSLKNIFPFCNYISMIKEHALSNCIIFLELWIGISIFWISQCLTFSLITLTYFSVRN